MLYLISLGVIAVAVGCAGAIVFSLWDGYRKGNMKGVISEDFVGFVFCFVVSLGCLAGVTYLDRSISFETAYVAYNAYEDKKFDEDELFELKWREGISKTLLREMESGKLSGDAIERYETFVNDLIDRYDSSEEKLEFKEKLLIRDRGIVHSFWEDEELSSQERRLIGFMGDVLERDVSDLYEGDRVDVSGIKRLMDEFGKDYPKFMRDVETEEAVEDVEEPEVDRFYRVED